MQSVEFKNKTIFLIATGAERVDKAEILVDNLQQKGATVFVFATDTAASILGTEALARLRGKCEVRQHFDWDKSLKELPEEDLIIVSPCTFNSLIKISLGLADNYALSITTSGVSLSKKIIIAPAFEEFWNHPLTQPTFELLRSWGVHILDTQLVEDKQVMVDTSTIIEAASLLLQKDGKSS